jgi:hypothetical protein
VLNFVQPAEHDAEGAVEVAGNKVIVLSNLAAVHMERCEHGAAAERCTEALLLSPGNVKLLLRRARAYAARAEYAAAEADVAAVKDAEPWSAEAEAQAREMAALRRRQGRGDCAFAEKAMRGVQR